MEDLLTLLAGGRQTVASINPSGVAVTAGGNYRKHRAVHGREQRKEGK
jgi:hypothetical protein